MVSEKRREEKRSKGKEAKRGIAKRKPITGYMHIAPVTNANRSHCFGMREPNFPAGRVVLTAGTGIDELANERNYYNKTYMSESKEKTRYELHAHGAGNECES